MVCPDVQVHHRATPAGLFSLDIVATDYGEPHLRVPEREGGLHFAKQRDWVLAWVELAFELLLVSDQSCP